ncbi:hypothetical protein FS749_006602 [Ceratobasidium sp. UAMH 11750]|nr:hypothetical protein FS749_006602 [Ceratobasidium sp. UAMH 11750]
MDLPEKGAHCGLASCQIFDLLPIRCTACQALFCKTHAQQDAHGCEAPVSVREPASDSTRVGCEVDGCGRAAVLKPAVGDTPAPGWSCDVCHGVYCISHRHTDTHNCVPVSRPPVVDKKAEAQALLTKLFPDAKAGGTSTARARPAPADPVKRAKLRAIELMKMKHKAVSADPSLARGSGIQAGDKIHLRVTYAPLKSEVVVWYRKDIVTGKAVDLAGRALSVSREDGRGMRFVRGHETDGVLDLKNELTLGGQIEDGDEVQLVKDVC